MNNYHGNDEKKAADDALVDEAIQAINDAQVEAEDLGFVSSTRTPPLGLSKEAMEAMMKQQNASSTAANNNEPSGGEGRSDSPNSTLSPLATEMKVAQDKGDGEYPILTTIGSGISNNSNNSWMGEEGPVAKPPGSKKHNRMVSWGIDGAPPNLVKASSNATSGEDNVSQLAPPDADSKISLQSVLNTTPYESEAESYLQRTLDDTDPTKLGPSEAQQSILGSVPAEATPSAFGGATGWGKLKAKALPHRRVKSTAEDLFSLAMDFENLNGSNYSADKDSSNHKKNGSSSADALANAGAALIRRNRAESSGSGDYGGVSAITGSRPSLAATRGKASLRLMGGQSTRTLGAGSDLEANMAANRVDEETSEENDDDGDDQNDQDSNEKGERGQKFRGLKRANYKLKANYKDFEQWLKYDQLGYRDYLKFVLSYFIIPLVGIAAILFYFTDNPPCGTTTQCSEIYGEGNSVSDLLSGVTAAAGEASNSTTIKEDTKVSIDSLRRTFETASISFWLLFLARQVVTFSLAKLAEAILIEYLALRTKIIVFFFGPMVTLFLVQSKGWPLVAVLWSFFDFFMLYGHGKFAQHWLFWQDAVKLFNLRNPGGTVTSSEDYRLILVVLMVVGVAVAVKRFWLGIFLGRQTFVRYADDLAKLMKKALLVGRVAALARDIEQRTARSTRNLNLDAAKYYEVDDSSKGNGSFGGVEDEEEDDSKVGADGPDFYAGLQMSSEQKVRILELLGAFEDPTDVSSQKDENAPISAIIQFRASLSRLNTPFPFGNTFGPAGTRGECIESIEGVYKRLMLNNPRGNALHFNTIAAMALRNDGELDTQLLKDLVKLFRPDRDGTLRLLDFAKSIDSVYKDLRLLRASVASHSRMDRAFEGIINVVFYFLLFCIVLWVMGMDPFALFASISGFVLGFAFMIGSACSKYFEGILLILVRHPYDVGDRIAVSNVNNETPPTGSSGWIVKDVTLFATTVIFGTTNEEATYSNGSLASSRIINAARSTKATVYFLFKFPIDTPLQRIKVFQAAIDKFVKARPREWIGLLAFRNTRVEADLGFVEYIIFCQHRESWQNIGALLNSKAELSSFALELMKKMKMRYHAPPMPVDLTLMSDMSKMMNPDLAFPDGNIATRGRTGTEGDTSADIESVEAMFK